MLEQESLQAVGIEVAGAAFVADCLVEVVNPSDFALERRNLEGFFVHVLRTIDVDAVLCYVDLFGKQLDGDFQNSLSWPCALAKHLQSQVNG